MKNAMNIYFQLLVVIKTVVQVYLIFNNSIIFFKVHLYDFNANLELTGAASLGLDVLAINNFGFTMPI